MQADVTAQWTRRLLIGAGALLVVPLLPMLVAAFATFPLGDDFSRSNDAHFLFDLPMAVEFVVFEWIHWSGRYSHTFSIIFFADSVRWPWVHGLLILSFLGVFFVAVRGIFLHAFTDASMDSNPKLPANLHFMLGIGLTATFVAAWPERLSLSTSASVVLVTLLAVPSLALAPRVTLVARQVLSGNIAAYRDAMESREAVIRQTQSGTVRVAPVANCPYPACIEEAVRDDPGVWPSDKIARYYGVPVLTAAPEPVLLEAGWGRERDAIVRRGLALALLQPGPSATFKEWWLLLDSPSAGPVGVTFHRDHWPLATPKTELSVIRLEGGGGAVRLGLGTSEVGTLTVELGGRTEVLRVPPVSR